MGTRRLAEVVACPSLTGDSSLLLGPRLVPKRQGYASCALRTLSLFGKLGLVGQEHGGEEALHLLARHVLELELLGQFKHPLDEVPRRGGRDACVAVTSAKIVILGSSK